MRTGLTIKQAAERYEITPATIYNFSKAGKVVLLKQDGETLVCKESIEAILYGVCPVCGRGFKRGNQRQRFCDKSCRQKANRAK